MLTGAGLPSSYDLRDEGVVTPVKLQNPWGTCWAFGGTAAAEISILSSLGLTAKETGLDLSERHLAYFANVAVTSDESTSQEGEGVYFTDTKKNCEFAGGDLALFTTIYSQGVGPVQESAFPYRGVDENGKSNYNSTAGTYSATDDWSIPAKNENGHSNRLLSSGFVLKDGNVLPKYWNDEKTEIQSGMDAIKQELINGRGVSLAYGADQSGKYASTDKEHGLLFAQYDYIGDDKDHCVCIVGYDDNYKASNFTHTKDLTGNRLTDSEGKELSDAEAEKLTTPPGDGAWIVKNSWGSESEYTTDDLGNNINRLAYGAKDSEGKASGYFYLSYYDKTIYSTESMTFSANLAGSDKFATLQYDFMPSLSHYFTLSKDSVMSSANIFTADAPMELKSISTTTGEANMRVTFAVYLLNDDAKTPTEGTLKRQLSQNFEYGGFHRVDLDIPVKLEKGQRFSIVSTASVVNNNGKREYSVSASDNINKEYAEAFNLDSYCTAVVNEGESFVYEDGNWSDWTNTLKEVYTDGKHDGMAVDNFSIKAYVVPVEEPDADDKPAEVKKEKNPVKVSAAAKTIKVKALKKNKVTFKPLKISKAQGKVTVAKVKKGTSAKIYGKITVNKSTGAVTFKKGTYKKGSYKIKLKVTAAGNDKYKAETISKVVKVKVK